MFLKEAASIHPCEAHGRSARVKVWNCRSPRFFFYKTWKMLAFYAKSLNFPTFMTILKHHTGQQHMSLQLAHV